MRLPKRIETVLSIVACAFALSASGCDEVAEACDLKLACPGEEESEGGPIVQGIAEGNASISGLRSVDAFFSAVVNFRGAAGQIKADVDALLARIAVSVGLEPGAASAEIKTALEAKIAANVEGGLTVNFQEPRCDVSANVVVEAAAKCDAEVDPGSAMVMCMGSCEVEASADVGCEGEAEVVCTGTAPSLACTGSCNGECEFAADVECKGACMGGCEGSCTVNVSGECGGTCEGKCDGECMADTDNSEDGCSGTCMGTCEGKCDLGATAECTGECSGECTGECMADVGGSCSGSCKGECEYTPPTAECSANASVSCRAEASASAMCEGKCEGEVTPPSVKAECEASAKAEASAKVECTPPSVDIQFELRADVAASASASAEFEAWVEGFKGHMSALAALEAKGKILAEASTGLVSAAGDAVTGAVSDISASGDIRASLGARCALVELPKVETEINAAVEDMMASVSAVADISAGVGL